jgi:monoamine oxidase
MVFYKVDQLGILPLSKEIMFDPQIRIIVVGAGIAGLSTARYVFNF